MRNMIRPQTRIAKYLIFNILREAGAEIEVFNMHKIWLLRKVAFQMRCEVALSHPTQP